MATELSDTGENKRVNPQIGNEKGSKLPSTEGVDDPSKEGEGDTDKKRFEGIAAKIKGRVDRLTGMFRSVKASAPAGVVDAEESELTEQMTALNDLTSETRHEFGGAAIEHQGFTKEHFEGVLGKIASLRDTPTVGEDALAFINLNKNILIDGLNNPEYIVAASEGLKMLILPPDDPAEDSSILRRGREIASNLMLSNTDRFKQAEEYFQALDVKAFEQYEVDSSKGWPELYDQGLHPASLLDKALEWKPVPTTSEEVGESLDNVSMNLAFSMHEGDMLGHIKFRDATASLEAILRTHKSKPEYYRAVRLLQDRFADPNTHDNTLRVMVNLQSKFANTKELTKDQARDAWEVASFIRDAVEKPSIERFGIDYDRLYGAWEEGAGTLEKYHIQNLVRIYSMEQQRPNQNITKTLIDTFGVQNFARYPEELLLDLFDKRNDADVPYGIALYAQADHEDEKARGNAAFYEALPQVFSLYRQAKELGYGLRVYEVGSVPDAEDALEDADSRYGQDGNNLIKFGLIAAHGSPNGIHFGRNWTADNPTSLIKSHLEESSDHGERFRKANKYCVPGAPWLFESCSTGYKDGIGQTVSRVTGMRVTAPTEPTSLHSVTLTKAESGVLHISAKYTGKAEAKTYNKGEDVTVA